MLLFSCSEYKVSTLTKKNHPVVFRRPKISRIALNEYADLLEMIAEMNQAL
jgi:hypothetical protein